MPRSQSKTHSGLRPQATSSKHARDHAALRQHRMRAMLAVVERAFLVDADRLVNRGGNIARSPAGARGEGGVLVSSADDLPAAHTAAGEDQRSGRAPVIATA